MDKEQHTPMKGRSELPRRLRSLAGSSSAPDSSPHLTDKSSSRLRDAHSKRHEQDTHTVDEGREGARFIAPSDRNKFKADERDNSQAEEDMRRRKIRHQVEDGSKMVSDRAHAEQDRERRGNNISREDLHGRGRAADPKGGEQRNDGMNMRRAGQPATASGRSEKQDAPDVGHRTLGRNGASLKSPEPLERRQGPECERRHRSESKKDGHKGRHRKDVERDSSEARASSGGTKTLKLKIGGITTGSRAVRLEEVPRHDPPSVAAAATPAPPPQRARHIRAAAPGGRGDAPSQRTATSAHPSAVSAAAAAAAAPPAAAAAAVSPPPIAAEPRKRRHRLILEANSDDEEEAAAAATGRGHAVPPAAAPATGRTAAGPAKEKVVSQAAPPLPQPPPADGHAAKRQRSETRVAARPPAHEETPPESAAGSSALPGQLVSGGVVDEVEEAEALLGQEAVDGDKEESDAAEEEELEEEEEVREEVEEVEEEEEVVEDGEEEDEVTRATRQRGLLEFPGGLDDVNPKKRAREEAEAERVAKREETARKRRLQQEKHARDSQANAIHKILGQDSTRKKREVKLQKQRKDAAQEKAAAEAEIGSNMVRIIMGPSGTTVAWSQDTPLPAFFLPRSHVRVQKVRDKCAVPACNNVFRYRDSITNIPLCSLGCYKEMRKPILDASPHKIKVDGPRHGRL